MSEIHASWQPRDLRSVEERPSVTPSLGALGLIYPGRRHVYSGPPESAKTLIAYIEALAIVRNGGRVILIDLEMGPWDARDRLRDLGATDDDLGALLYVEPEVAANPETIASLLALAPDLVVIDAAAGIFALQQLDDNKRGDVEAFARFYLHAFRQQSIATVTLDHVVKSSEARGKFAVGSERKVGGADVHLGFEAVKPLHRGGTGLIKITTHKDRLGHIARPTAAIVRLVSDPVTHAITWTIEHDSDEQDEGDGWQPTELMHRVSDYMADRPAQTLSRNAICDAVKGRKKWVLRAIDELVRAGYLSQPDGSRGVIFVKRFPVPGGSAAVPGTGSPVPTPLKGGTGTGTTYGTEVVPGTEGQA